MKREPNKSKTANQSTQSPYSERSDSEALRQNVRHRRPVIFYRFKSRFERL